MTNFRSRLTAESMMLFAFILVYAAGFIVVPYYLFKTRGARGFPTLLIFVSMFVISMLLDVLAAALWLGPEFG